MRSFFDEGVSMAQCGTCHHMEEEIIAVRNGEKGPMMREVTLRCSVTILAQEVSPVSGVHDRHLFGAVLLFLFLWRIVRCLCFTEKRSVSSTEYGGEGHVQNNKKLLGCSSDRTQKILDHKTG